MTNKKTDNNKSGSQQGQRNSTPKPIRRSDTGGTFNDNGGRKSSDTTNSGGPREKG